MLRGRKPECISLANNLTYLDMKMESKLMNPKERVLATIQHKLPDRIPTDAIHIENITAIAARQSIPDAAVLDFLGIDGRIVSAPHTGCNPIGRNGARLSEWGTIDTGDYGTHHTYPLSSSCSTNDLERYPWPDPASNDFAAARLSAEELSRTYAVRGPYWKPLFCQVCDLLGLEETLVMLKTDHLLFEALLEHVFAYTYAYCQRLLDACGTHMPILCLGDDFATQRGLMIDPADWRRFLKPLLARLFDLGKQQGKYIWFHSCGDITSILPDLINIGMDVWETVQLHALPISAEKLKQEYGKDITFFGGINTQHLPFASTEEVINETLRCIAALGRDGGYICGPDHHIKPDVSVDATIALFSTARTFSRPGYTLL
jgi:uroporphyrinogen decarboxylase